MHILERLQMENAADDYLEKQIHHLEETFKRFKDQIAKIDPERFQNTAYVLATHLAYLSSRFHKLDENRIETFVGWLMLRSLMKTDATNVPYWMDVDMDQFLIDRGEKLFPAIAQFKTLPRPFGFLEHSAFSGIGKLFKLETRAPGLFAFLWEGHSLEMDLFNKTLSYDGKEVSFSRGILSLTHRIMVNTWILNKQKLASAEALLSKWLDKTVSVLSIESNTRFDFHQIHTSEGTFLLDLTGGSSTLTVNKKYNENKGLLHSETVSILTIEEQNLWRKNPEHMPSPTLFKIDSVV
jgi:hypothetical protein